MIKAILLELLIIYLFIPLPVFSQASTTQCYDNALEGDYNCDGDVNVFDFEDWNSNYALSKEYFFLFESWRRTYFKYLPTPTNVPATPPPSHTPMPTLIPSPQITATPTLIPSATAVPSATVTPPPIACSYRQTSFNSIDVPGPHVADASVHPDININIRGYVPTQQNPNLVDYGGDTDPDAPYFPNVLGRVPSFTEYQVYDWNWNAGTKGSLISNPPVTMMGMVTDPGSDLKIPSRNAKVNSDYTVIVLYATEKSLTLKYTLEDSVVTGYTVHFDDICVDANLVDAYNQANSSGRSKLPAVTNNQFIGKSTGQTVKVSVRDVGSFMDPRSRKDWW